MDQSFLSFLVFLPLVFAILGIFVPSRFSKFWAFLGSFVVFVFSLKLYHEYQEMGPAFQLTENLEWIPSLGAKYAVGIDGISLWLVLLTTFLMPIVILGSFTAVEDRVKEFYNLLLALQTGMLGAFVALDTFLFYVFWEAMLIPMYFLVGIWGGKERIFAATKLFLYTIVGSLLMLVAIFYLSYQHKLQFGQYSTLITDLYKLQLDGNGYFSPQGVLFLAFAVAFAIKVPLFPLHTWLPDAHVQAPTAGSVILAGVLLKMGGYGFIRFAFPLFPQAVATYQTLFIALGTIAITYGAWVAMVQPDVKKLVAYSSVSHMGYVVIGLFSLNQIGVGGSVYQMLNHGISTPALFLLIGMIYERRHTRMIKDFGGITKVMPIFALVFMIVTLSSVALPGTNGFVGEFMILLGTFKANPFWAVIATTGVIFGAVYMLWMFQRVMFGPLTHPENQKLEDLNARELGLMIPLLVAIIVMGVFPNFVFKKMNPSIDRVIAQTLGANKHE
jgi:NADH-quinone oxidoreductase subunit M